MPQPRRHTRPSFRIDPARESPAFLQLFSIAVDEADRLTHGAHQRFDVPPGPLLAWRRTVPAALVSFAALAHGPAPPDGCPPFIARTWKRWPDGVFLPTLDAIVRCGPPLGITDAVEVCRVLAAAAQTLLTTVPAVRDHNRRIAQTYLPAARSALRAHAPVQAARPVSAALPAAPSRADEQGARVTAGPLVAVHASHIGPRAGDKPENQDATAVAACGTTMVFALADGVTTSTGARFAAAFASETMCREIGDALAAGQDDGGLLVEAAIRTQAAMDAQLAAIVHTGDLSPLRSTLPIDSTLRFIQNTQTGTNARLAPVLCATLVAGFVRPAADGGGSSGAVLLIGDGVVENVAADGSVARVIDMDATVTKITAVLGPGPRSRRVIPTASIVRPLSLGPRDALLISSDGLTRGHAGTVWSVLNPPRDWARAHDPPLAWTLLDRAARRADADDAEKGGDGALFADNLSVIIVGRADAWITHGQN